MTLAAASSVDKPQVEPPRPARVFDYVFKGGIGSRKTFNKPIRHDRQLAPSPHD